MLQHVLIYRTNPYGELRWSQWGGCCRSTYLAFTGPLLWPKVQGEGVVDAVDSATGSKPDTRVGPALLLLLLLLLLEHGHPWPDPSLAVAVEAAGRDGTAPAQPTIKVEMTLGNLSAGCMCFQARHDAPRLR